MNWKDSAARNLRYWHDTTVDRVYGGYRCGAETDKFLVTQARLLWSFSYVTRHGLGNCLEAASHGHHFLQEFFLDSQLQGYRWSTDIAGRPVDDRKMLYGQAFALFGLVEYGRASRSQDPLNQALSLFHAVQKYCHQRGWVEHHQRDWSPVGRGLAVPLDIAGYRGANAHLHWMEALIELYRDTRNSAVEAALQEALDINGTWFFPNPPHRSRTYRLANGWPAWRQAARLFSYGHSVEAAWLMAEGQQVLGRPVSWTHFDALIEHTLQYGFDIARGGVYRCGPMRGPATNTDKVWWAQAEMIAALVYSLRQRPHPRYSEALHATLDFVQRHQIDPADGVWLDTVSAAGQPLVTTKAHRWKANYHDMRAMVMLIESGL